MTDKKEMLMALDYLKNAEVYWNPHEGIIPKPLAIRTAKHFVNHLPENKRRCDLIEPDYDGGVVLKWVSKGSKTFITLDGDGLLHMSYKPRAKGNAIFADNIKISLSCIKIPNGISDYIPNKGETK